ncbi:MAG: disulfide bond formation protein B [bacterium]|nr:disulfide bond formation protein B [bacterium]
MYPIETINYYLALAVIAMQIVGVAFLFVYFARRKFPDLAPVADFLGKWGLWIGFLLSIGGIAVSLFYSEIFGVLPCGLCWLQRVFLYPQALLFALAIWKSDRNVADYSISFSIVGGIIAFYQHYLQMGGASILPCPAVGTGADCAQRYLFEFGYITFPLMSFTIFAFLIIVMLFVRRRFVI